MRWLALIALAGCDRFLSLHEVTSSGDASSTASEPGPVMVTGTAQLTYTTNMLGGCAGASPCTVVDTLTSAQGTGTATLDDGTHSTVSYQPDGSFSFMLEHAGQAYRLQLTNGAFGFDVESTSPTLTLNAIWPARPSYTSAEAISQTNITYAVSGTLAGEAWIASTGIWTNHAFDSTVLPFTQDWRDTGIEIAPLGLLDYSIFGDQLYVFDQVPTNHNIIAQVATLAADMVNGVALTVTGALKPITTPNMCVTASAAPATEYDSLVSHVPSAEANVGGVSMQAEATASTATGQVGSILVLYDGFSSGAIPGSYALTKQAFTNPLPDTTTIFSSNVSTLRPASVGGATAYQFGVQARVVVPVPSNCTTDVALDTTAIAIPTAIRVGDVTLLADNQAVVLPTTGFVHVTWANGSSGTVEATADLATVEVWQLEALGGVTFAHVVTATVTATTDVFFDASLFTSGSTYIIEITNALGYPNAAHGDTTHVAYPFGIMQNYSTTFAVD